MLKPDNLIFYVMVSSAVAILSIPFWADGYDKDLLEQSVLEYKEETGDTVYRGDDTISFIAISQQGTVRRIELHNIFDAEISDIIELEEVK